MNWLQVTHRFIQCLTTYCACLQKRPSGHLWKPPSNLRASAAPADEGQRIAMSRTAESIKVAAVHSAAPFLDLDAGVELAIDYIQQAGRQGAHIVAFPETYLPGYPYWIWSHTSKHSAPLYAELFHNAVDLKGAASQALADAAGRAGVWVVMGMNERDGGTLYNTQAYYSPQGELVARHRKLQPTNAE